MRLSTLVYIVILETFVGSFFLQYECRKLDGYNFSVYTTTICPRNETEWTERSSALNCNKSNGYMCLPNENFDELLEFCYIVPFERIQEGICLYLVKRVSLVNAYNCSRFTQGCPNHPFFSNEIFEYPACISIGNGCFLAEKSCESSKTISHPQNTTHHFETVMINERNGSTTHPQQSSEHTDLDNTPINNNDNALLVPIFLGTVFLFCIIFLLAGYCIKRKFSICKSNSDIESSKQEKLKKSNNQAISTAPNKEESPFCQRKGVLEIYEEGEIEPLLECEDQNKQDSDGLEKEEIEKNKHIKHQESKLENDIFDQWKQVDSSFISTKACEEVEKLIKSRNLVIVVGYSGSGKSAIIQHIALRYRKQGWIIKRVKHVKEIVDEYSSSRFQKNKTICIFNDPLGKESFDEILNNAWQTYEEELNLYLKTAKLVMSCRNHIVSDSRLTRYLVNQSHIVNIDDNKNKLSVNEKRQILAKYTSNIKLSDIECDEIVEVEKYFPLLCKLYSNREENNNKGIGFFTKPVTMLKEELLGFRKKDKGKYCALALLVLFNDDLCVSDLLKNKDTECKFKHTLKLCGLSENTPPSTIGDNLNSIKDFFVKKVGDTYHFYHDFVMEVTTYIFGTDYPAETIRFADIGFLRRRVTLESCEVHNDLFTIYLSDRYITELGERLYSELLGERSLEVVLNPCLRNEKIIDVLKQKVADHPENLQMLLETKTLTIDKPEFDWNFKSVLMSKLKFLKLDNGVSSLFTLIVFCHTQLSLYCLNALQQKQINFTNRFLTSAMCCNGSIELFNYVFKDHAEESLKRPWEGLYPIHIVSVFHNYELLKEIIKIGGNVNQKTKGGWTPLIFAAENDTNEYTDYYHSETGSTRRDKTVQLLLSTGANINLCKEDGVSPLYKACKKGHNSTVQLLLRNGAYINSCKKNGASPLLIACENGHNSTVQLLLSKGADIKLCMENGASPLHLACQKGHGSTIQIILSNGANIDSCMKNGVSPLYIACKKGHNSTAQLLLSNGANINSCRESGASPFFKACEIGNDSTVQLLLSNGADVNLCKKNGASPLYIACQNGHTSTVQLLLRNGADINLCMENGASPLQIACKKGHDSTVQLLLKNGADINLCTKHGASPLFTACQKGHTSTVQLLLRNGAHINTCMENGDSPLQIACQKGHDSTVQLLLKNGADINLCAKHGASPLFTACQKGHDSTVKILLRNGANINLCTDDGVSPLYIACQNGHDSTIQRLLRNGADINLCMEDGTSPLFIACENGHDSSVQLLFCNGADMNIYMKDGISPLYIAFVKRNYKIINILLNKSVDISLACGWEVNPALVDCLDKHGSTMDFLMHKENIRNNMYDLDSYFSLFVSCQVERVARMIFEERV